MSIGSRRHRLIVQSRPVPGTKDSRGKVVEVWTDSFYVNGSFESVGTREFPSYQKLQSETTGRFRIPSGQTIDPGSNRILMVEDYSTSPITVSIWDIQAPQPVQGKPYERTVEAVRIT